mgnify:CR=1 FL=1
MGNSFDHSIKINGNVSGEIFNNGAVKNVSAENMHINNATSAESGSSLEKQIRQDLEQMQTCLKQIQRRKPDASQAEANDVLTKMTPKLVKKRLVAAIASGGKAAISEFLDNAYAKVVIATIEGWRS